MLNIIINLYFDTQQIVKFIIFNITLWNIAIKKKSFIIEKLKYMYKNRGIQCVLLLFVSFLLLLF